MPNQQKPLKLLIECLAVIDATAIAEQEKYLNNKENLMINMKIYYSHIVSTVSTLFSFYEWLRKVND